MFDTQTGRYPRVDGGRHGKGMLLIERPRVQRDAAFFVLSLLEVAHRTLPSAKGYQAERALAVLDQ